MRDFTACLWVALLGCSSSHDQPIGVVVIEVRGTGIVRVEGVGPATECRELCEYPYSAARELALTAQTSSSRFIGWSDPCSVADAETCNLALAAGRTEVTASFTGCGGVDWLAQGPSAEQLYGLIAVAPDCAVLFGYGGTGEVVLDSMVLDESVARSELPVSFFAAVKRPAGGLEDLWSFLPAEPPDAGDRLLPDAVEASIPGIYTFAARTYGSIRAGASTVLAEDAANDTAIVEFRHGETSPSWSIVAQADDAPCSSSLRPCSAVVWDLRRVDEAVVVVAGDFFGTDMALGETSLTGEGFDGFLARVGSGREEWVVQAGGPSVQSVERIVYDPERATVFVLGAGVLPMFVSDTNLSTDLDESYFIAAIDVVDGGVLWATPLGFPRHYEGGGGGGPLMIKPAPHWVLDGDTLKVFAAILGPIEVAPEVRLTGEEPWSWIVVRYDLNGQFLGAATLSRGELYIRQVQALGDGRVGLVGDLRGTVELGGAAITSAGGLDILAAEVTNDGAVAWFTTFGGVGDDYGQAVHVDEEGRWVIGGVYSDELDLGDRGVVRAGPGRQGSFAARIRRQAE